MMTILYPAYGNLYVNLTNKCPCACTFCLRQTHEEIQQSGSLWLDREPTVEEVEKEFDKFPPDTYNDIVFCGFGEPTERLDALLEVAEFAKKKFGKKIRINTNGLGSLIHGKDITPLLQGKIDAVSISLNTPNAEEYYKLTRNKFGIESFQAMLDFAKEATKYVPEVVMTTVETTITKEEEQECQKICDSLGVRYRIRPFED